MFVIHSSSLKRCQKSDDDKNDNKKGKNQKIRGKEREEFVEDI